MAYLSVLRQKKLQLVGFSRISSFVPVTEKEIFSKMFFQFGENNTPVWLYFCGFPRENSSQQKTALRPGVIRSGVGEVRTVELEVKELRVTSLLNFTMTKWFVVTIISLFKMKF